MPAVARTIEISAPPSEVWRWLATPEALRQWLSPDLDIDLRPGGAYRLGGPDGQTPISGVVLDLVPEGGLVLSWLEEEAGWEHPARLAVTLEATPGGTRVSLVHDGFPGTGPSRERIQQAYEAGADRHQVLARLAALITAARV